MKLIQATTITILLLFPSILFAQNKNNPIVLKTGSLSFDAGLRKSAVDSFNMGVPRYHNKTLFIIQFKSIPSATSKKLLSANGIELLNCVADHTYLTSITGNLKLSVLQQAGSNGFIQLLPQYKLEPELAKGIIPAYAVKVAGTADVLISFAQTFSLTEVEQFLTKQNIDIVGNEAAQFGQLTLRIPPSRIPELAACPFVEYVQSVPPDPESLNQSSRGASRATILNTTIANGGKGLNGEGITLGIGDDGNIQRHVDFSDRMINRNFLSNAHGVHVNGTAAGAGNINELYRGYAPKSTIISDIQRAILYNTPLYVSDYNMVVTNNSYGSSLPSCPQNGMYELDSRFVDLLALSYPQVLHVFASGNAGNDNCPPFSTGFRTVLRGYQSAKNILTVGATNDSSLIAAFSSRGPVMDGRIKPEIVAMGQSVISAWPDNTYSFGNGTSMAAPAITGGAALLYQRYRQLHNNANPDHGLIKAILCNGADDKGNPGPDYKYGFGSMNLVRSLEILERQQHFIADVSNGVTNTHTISIPSNTAQVKVMLYWNDPASSPLRIQHLINDLDVELATPGNTVVLPKILDTIPAHINNNATSGADHINNIEQVVADNPDAGNYTIRVKGTSISENPAQKYYLVYDIVPVSLTLTYPVGGEGLVPGDFVKIAWDAYGNTSNTFNLDYSIDNGSTWINIASNLDAGRRIYTWQVPAVASSNAMIRVGQNGSGIVDISNHFTIIGLPVVTLSAAQCEGSINIQWPVVTSAADYEVMMLQGDAMRSIGTTTSNSWHFNNLSPDSTYWVAVRARMNNKPGRRSVAISRQPNSGNCSDPVFNNDLKLDSILSPVSGRKYTSTELSSTHTVRVRIKNLDDAASNGFTIKYSLNNGPWMTETVNTIISAGSSYVHSFATTADLSVIGSYTLTAVVENLTADPNVSNDTLRTEVKQLDNQPLALAPSTLFLDDLETAEDSIYRTEVTGLSGLDRYDFENLTTTSELRTFYETGVAYSGQRSFMPSERVTRTLTTRGLNSVTGTFNLSGESVASNDIRLDFRYLVNIGGPNNDVWIRGSDTQPWIKIWDFNGNTQLITDTVYRLTNSFELGDTLAAYGQQFTSSFQVRWRESHYLVKYPGARMYSIDDIRLYEVQNDLHLVSIDTPIVVNCGSPANMPVRISIFNSSNAPLTNIPVKYSLNDGNWVTETIPSIAANTKIQYTFNQPADLSAQTVYQLKTVVSFPGDTYRSNDTAWLTLKSTPLITNYPHLQNFESGNGGWYPEEATSSWEYGTPASPKINRAASGTKAWKTRLAGSYNKEEASYLYSPCYQINGMTHPTLSFSMAIDIDDCGLISCSYARVEYSVDGGTWGVLGLSSSDGTNWYNTMGGWQIEDYTRWHVTTFPLPVSNGLLRLRIAFYGGPFNAREGIAIDDIHIYDNNKGIYDGVTMSAPVTKPVSANNWIDFENGGKLIASINANGQDLGPTDIQTYINSSAVRYTGSQYYLDRNVTIKPSNAASDSVTVRLYFLDTESEDLIDASGCQLCSKPGTSYALGVSKYNDANRTLENGMVADNNLQGNWSFIHPDRVKKVPFDKGYYAEFKTKNFSEFWLNTGGLDNNSPLPVQVFEFSAEKIAGDNVLLKWKTANETGIVKYEIELARGHEAFQNNQFAKIGEKISQPATTVQQYEFTDIEADKFGARYYRLKIIYSNGNVNYSPARMVIFDDAVLWKIYPNPSTGIFHLIGQFAAGQKLEARITDTKGSLVKTFSMTATGFVQKLSLDLSSVSGGIYLLRLDAGETKQVFKLYKN